MIKLDTKNPMNINNWQININISPFKEISCSVIFSTIKDITLYSIYTLNAIAKV